MLSLLLSAVASADIFTFNDPFPCGSGPGGGSCLPGAPPANYPGRGDVVGDHKEFDIQKLVFSITQQTLGATIYFNYGPGSTLDDWFPIPGLSLAVGDLIINNQYGVPLHGHHGLTAGSLYAVDTLLLSSDELGLRSDIVYRPDQVVRFTSLGAGTPGTLFNISYNAAADPSFVVSWEGPTPAALWNLYSSGAPLAIHFASATCGNDIVDGTAQRAVPEPSAFLLMGTLLAGLGLRFRKR
ncbi:MAG: PEP-CTERM sorting domain-containing protein [Acidobacteria bacterium]|nr:PEP-CTERM sorting domain-containing protein [Acidobacteriota bacterium]MBI3470734.1 PEP-CTERM sorting domain-containing protein [Candidatus Solibacter usitatus]